MQVTSGHTGIGELNIYFPGQLIVGAGSLNRLADEVVRLSCRKVLMITIHPLLTQLQSVNSALKDNSIELLIDTTIVQEPTFADFNNLMKRIGSFVPDVIVGVGGGSVLDIAKLVAVQLGNEQSLEDYVGIGLVSGRKKKLICLPATAGTGSEVSPNAILVDNRDGQKKGIISRYLVPDVVIVDPLLTLSVPPSVTAATGIDALTHCLEAFTNRFAHPVVDLWAYEGMRLISSNIARAVRDGNDVEARTAVALGSLYGGFCLGPVNTAAVHALSYPLGSMYHLPHGLSNALLLPYVMEFNLHSATQRYAQVALALGCPPGTNDLLTARAGVEQIKKLVTGCGLPLTLSEVGVDTTDLPVMAEAALKIQRLLKNNPREVTMEDAINIYKAAHS